MGLLDQLGQAAGGMMGSGGDQSPLMKAVIGLLGQNSSVGGLGGLIQAFQKKRPGGHRQLLGQHGEESPDLA